MKAAVVVLGVFGMVAVAMGKDGQRVDKSVCQQPQQSAKALLEVRKATVELHAQLRDLRVRSDLPTRATTERMLCFSYLAQLERNAVGDREVASLD